MPFNGAGSFSVYTPGTPFVTGTTISSTVANNVNSDFATGLSTALLKDGTQTATAAIPFGQGVKLGVGTDALNAYAVGTFTATLTGVSGTVTGTAKYTIIGNAVILNIPNLQGTSNATSKTITGAPAAIFPAAAKNIAVIVSDNGGNNAISYATMATNGVITVQKDAAGSNWTNSGTATVNLFQLAYTLA